MIKPEGLVTTYRIALECKAAGTFAECDPRWVVEGELPTTEGGYEESLHVTGLAQTGEYRFSIDARNSAGEASWTSGVIGPNQFSGCVGCDEPYTPKELPWANEWGQEAAAATVREQRAKEAAEAKAAEAKTAEEAARKRQAEEDLVLAHAQHCVVPGLRGDTLRVARRKIAAAHCGLGGVKRLRGHRGVPVVAQQTPRRGMRLKDGARIALMLRSR